MRYCSSGHHAAPLSTHPCPAGTPQPARKRRRSVQPEMLQPPVAACRRHCPLRRHLPCRGAAGAPRTRRAARSVAGGVSERPRECASAASGAGRWELGKGGAPFRAAAAAAAFSACARPTSGRRRNSAPRAAPLQWPVHRPGCRHTAKWGARAGGCVWPAQCGERRERDAPDTTAALPAPPPQAATPHTHCPPSGTLRSGRGAAVPQCGQRGHAGTRTWPHRQQARAFPRPRRGWQSAAPSRACPRRLAAPPHQWQRGRRQGPVQGVQVIKLGAQAGEEGRQCALQAILLAGQTGQRKVLQHVSPEIPHDAVCGAGGVQPGAVPCAARHSRWSLLPLKMWREG